MVGGANLDIAASSSGAFLGGDCNPGHVAMYPGGVGRNIAHNLALLGDDVSFLSVFGGDDFGRLVAQSCEAAGMDISRCETIYGVRGSCFVSMNGPSGEMLGGVSDMDIMMRITPSWLELRADVFADCGAVVADTNIPAESLAWLLSNVSAPIYVDAVSGAKAVRLAGAMRLSGGRAPFAIKCNQIESQVVDSKVFEKVSHAYVSLGADGVLADDTLVPAVPCSVRNTMGAGDALFAGIIHAGPSVSAVEAARLGVICAKYAAESDAPVNDSLKKLVQ